MRATEQTTVRLLILHLLLILTVGMVSACAMTGEPSNLAGAPEPPREAYLLGPGDLIEIQVWNEPGLSGPQRVRLDGQISLPLIGEVKAAGQTPKSLAALLELRFNRILTDSSVTVTLSQSSQRYYVIGKVRAPGEFTLDTPITVLQALARSGGFVEWAKTSKIRIIRRTDQGTELVTFNYDEVGKKSNINNLPMIYHGDTVIVP